MKSYKLLLLVVCICTLPTLMVSQQVNGRFSTSLYGWEKFDTVGSSMHLYRGYQNIQVDVIQNNISFHTYLSAASKFSSSFGDDAVIRISSVFMRWKDIGNVADLNIGRVPVFAGVGNCIVDGILLKAKVWENKLSLAGYGGANVTSDLRSKGFSNFDKNFLVGGQLIAYFLEGSRVSLSYINRQRGLDGYSANRLDSLFNAVSVYVQPETRKEQILGFDASYDYNRKVFGYGRFDYDLNTKKPLRGELNTRITIIQKLALTGTYIYRQPRVFNNSFFSVFPTNPMNEYEGGIEYSFCSSFSSYGRIAYVQYKDDVSRRLTVGISTSHGSVQYSGSNGYSGQLASFSAEGMCPLFDRKFIPTVAFSFATYRLIEGVSKKEEILAGSLGAILHPMQSISTDAQIQWIRNKVVNSDVRLFCRISYWFSHNFSQSQQEGTDK